MWTKQQQRHDFDNYVDWRASKTRTSYEYDDSWEEQAFAEDASGPLGGCIWPPRSYSCSFCRREFRSAQALGGHMNVHRRDRARLKQTPNPQNNPFTSLSFQSPSQAQQVCTLVYDVPNPKTYPTSSAMTDVMSCNRSKSDPNFQVDEKTRVFDPTINNKDYVETGFSKKGLSIDFGQSRPTSSTASDDQEESGTRSKRRKTDDGKSIQFCFKSSSLVERHHHIQSEVIGLSSTSLHELDLELRLGAL